MEGVEVVGERERREGGGSEEGEGVREGLSSALSIAIPPSMWTTPRVLKVCMYLLHSAAAQMTGGAGQVGVARTWCPLSQQQHC